MYVQTIFLPHQHGRSALDTSRTLFLLASTQGVSCRLVMNHLIYMYMFSLKLFPEWDPDNVISTEKTTGNNQFDPFF